MRNNDKLVDSVALAVVLIGATLLTRKSVAETWSKVAHKPAPPERSNQDVDLSEAVTWAVASGIAVGLVRFAIRRFAYPGSIRD